MNRKLRDWWNVETENFLRPQEIYLQAKEDETIEVKIVCDCDWEEEHGLIIVFINGKTLKEIGNH